MISPFVIWSDPERAEFEAEFGQAQPPPTATASGSVVCGTRRDAAGPQGRPASTSFATADIRPLGFEDGVRFCRDLPQRCGVAAIPTSVFYDDPAIGRHLVRFAFCKRVDRLTEAVNRLSG